MNVNKTGKHHMDTLFTLLLFGVFAACVLFVLLTGANVYRDLTLRDQAAYAHRTCAQYIAAKVRQAPSPDAVRVEEFGGDALVLSQDIDGWEYLTRIYCYDGWLRELFAQADGELAPQDGEKIIEAQGLELELADGVLSVYVTDSTGRTTALSLLVRGGEEAAS